MRRKKSRSFKVVALLIATYARLMRRETRPDDAKDFTQGRQRPPGHGPQEPSTYGPQRPATVESPHGPQLPTSSVSPASHRSSLVEIDQKSSLVESDREEQLTKSNGKDDPTTKSDQAPKASVEQTTKSNVEQTTKSKMDTEQTRKSSVESTTKSQDDTSATSNTDDPLLNPALSFLEGNAGFAGSDAIMDTISQLETKLLNIAKRHSHLDKTTLDESKLKPTTKRPTDLSTVLAHVIGDSIPIRKNRDSADEAWSRPLIQGDWVKRTPGSERGGVIEIEEYIPELFGGAFGLNSFLMADWKERCTPKGEPKVEDKGQPITASQIQMRDFGHAWIKSRAVEGTQYIVRGRTKLEDVRVLNTDDSSLPWDTRATNPLSDGIHPEERASSEGVKTAKDVSSMLEGDPESWTRTDRSGKTFYLNAGDEVRGIADTYPPENCESLKVASDCRKFSACRQDGEDCVTNDRLIHPTHRLVRFTDPRVKYSFEGRVPISLLSEKYSEQRQCVVGKAHEDIVVGQKKKKEGNEDPSPLCQYRFDPRAPACDALNLLEEVSQDLIPKSSDQSKPHFMSDNSLVHNTALAELGHWLRNPQRNIDVFDHYTIGDVVRAKIPGCLTDGYSVGRIVYEGNKLKVKSANCKDMTLSLDDFSSASALEQSARTIMPAEFRTGDVVMVYGSSLPLQGGLTKGEPTCGWRIGSVRTRDGKYYVELLNEKSVFNAYRTTHFKGASEGRQGWARECGHGKHIGLTVYQDMKDISHDLKIWHLSPPGRLILRPAIMRRLSENPDIRRAVMLHDPLYEKIEMVASALVRALHALSMKSLKRFDDVRDGIAPDLSETVADARLPPIEGSTESDIRNSFALMSQIEDFTGESLLQVVSLDSLKNLAAEQAESAILGTSLRDIHNEEMFKAARIAHRKKQSIWTQVPGYLDFVSSAMEKSFLELFWHDTRERKRSYSCRQLAPEQDSATTGQRIKFILRLKEPTLPLCPGIAYVPRKIDCIS